jgi:YVTN family beta-propeller protein
MKKIFLVIIVLVILFSGCNRDTIVNSNPPTITNSKKGLYILCEGSGAGTSKLSYYDLDSVFYVNIIKPGSLGLYPDGLITDGTNLFITEQGNYNAQGMIYKTDTGGTIINSQVVGLNPYSLCIRYNKIYITNGRANNVSVVDKDNLSTIKTINVGVNPQEILAAYNKVFVCNAGNFSSPHDSTVSVIDANLDSVINVITLRNSPSAITLSNENKLLIGCQGANGKIFIVDPNNFSKIDSFSVVGGFDRDISVDANSQDIYFISYDNRIVKLNLASGVSGEVINNPSPASVYFYGYVFDSKSKIHYVANARNFVSSGLIHKYDISGNMLSFYTTGIAPRRLLLFNN